MRAARRCFSIAAILSITLISGARQAAAASSAEASSGAPGKGRAVSKRKVPSDKRTATIFPFAATMSVFCIRNSVYRMVSPSKLETRGVIISR